MVLAIFAADRGLIQYMVGKKFILYQTEQIHSEYGLFSSHAGYQYMINQASIIFEYSPYGLSFLQRHGMGSKSHYLPPAYHRIWEMRDRSFDQGSDIDVLFYGTTSERRVRIISDLYNKGVNVVALDYSHLAYGPELEKYVGRAKVILNVHQFDDLDVLETVRLAPLVASGKFVISEQSDHNPYAHGVVFAHYDALVQTCIHFLSLGVHERQSIADRGRSYFRLSSFRIGFVKSYRQQTGRILFDLIAAKSFPEVGLEG